MYEFQGRVDPPLFTDEDLEEILDRQDKQYEHVEPNTESLAKVYVKHLCRVYQHNGQINQGDWVRMREWVRQEIPEQAQQLKKDLFRLLKAVNVAPEED